MMRISNIKLSYTRAREIIREDLSSIGINMNNYGLHSLRSGGASAAYKCDVPDRLFKVHDRWKSENANDGYVCEDLEKRLSVLKIWAYNLLSLYVEMVTAPVNLQLCLCFIY